MLKAEGVENEVVMVGAAVDANTDPAHLLGLDRNRGSYRHVASGVQVLWEMPDPKGVYLFTFFFFLQIFDVFDFWVCFCWFSVGC